MRKLKTRLFLAAVFVITFIANTSAAMACNGWHYQPKLPDSLKK